MLAVSNLFLFLFSLKFLVNKDFLEIRKQNFYDSFRRNLPYLFLIIGVCVFHVLEVNLIDPAATSFVGHDFADAVQKIEGDIVYQLHSGYSTLFLTGFFTVMYIVVYPFTLWFVPLYVVFYNGRRPIRGLANGLFLTYMIALPFYLFLPATNVYTYYKIDSALETVIPSVENFFYMTTTHNNSFPSLHTSVAILMTWVASLTGNKKLEYFTFFCMVSVIISVVYLGIHWLIDVASGALISTGVILILRNFIRESGRNDV